MKQRNVIICGLLLIPLLLQGQTEKDSLLQFLVDNKMEVEQIVNGYKKISFSWTQFVVTFVTAILMVGLSWKYWGKEKFGEYVRKQTQEAIDNMNNLKTTNILVLTSEQGDEKFIRSFFKNKNFSNVKYVQIANEVKKPDDFDYELVFANNDDNKLNSDIVRQYLREGIALFYFSTDSRWELKEEKPEIKRSINFANSRAQIYGNLMSSLEFLDLANPKIKNV